MNTILGIETSCDETAIAIVREGRFVIAQRIASQADIHQKYGGVIPEIAARNHVTAMLPLLNETLAQAKMTKNDIDAIAVTVGPGLVTALMVGVDTAKSLAWAWNKPIIPVNHIKGHIYANQIQEIAGESIKDAADFIFPSICLTVSGGHTEIVLVESHEKLTRIGHTVDDAAGEAFDKVANILNLGYPGGPLVSNMAEKGDVHAFAFPRPMSGRASYEMSFSGLKTAVKRLIETEHITTDKQIADVCASFEQAVVDVLVEKTMAAAKHHNVKRVMLSGGVAANKRLRTQLSKEARQAGMAFTVPPIELCTDNAVMIAVAAWFDQRVTPFEHVHADPQYALYEG
jgi:N6-L-threonylcarbamoyladenine synthase